MRCANKIHKNIRIKCDIKLKNNFPNKNRLQTHAIYNLKIDKIIHMKSKLKIYNFDIKYIQV